MGNIICQGLVPFPPPVVCTRRLGLSFGQSDKNAFDWVGNWAQGNLNPYLVSVLSRKVKATPGTPKSSVWCSAESLSPLQWIYQYPRKKTLSDVLPTRHSPKSHLSYPGRWCSICSLCKAHDPALTTTTTPLSTYEMLPARGWWTGLVGSVSPVSLKVTSLPVTRKQQQWSKHLTYQTPQSIAGIQVGSNMDNMLNISGLLGNSLSVWV